jgi:hypothetical protein
MSLDREYLINQLQFQLPSASRLELKFRHPFKEIVWLINQTSSEKKFKREYLNFKLIEWEELTHNSIKTLDHVKNSPGIPLYYFYRKFILN